MKPDASVDFYGLLGIQPNANDDEIKKAFRKQALLHHPDRNPGREDEAKAKFQDMQAAYDTLSTAEKRTKYDNERLKRGNLWQKRPAPATRASTNAPVPPTAPKWGSNTTQARPPPRSTAGASRYADFSNTSRDSSPFYGSDVNAKFQAFKAFENMKGGSYKPASAHKGSPPKTRAAPTAQKTRTRSDWDETDLPESPRRAQSTRTPRKTGFNPYAGEGDDTSSRNTSAYYNVNKGGVRPNIFAQAGIRPGGASQSSAGNGNGEDAFGERISTPYSSKTGEKTYFSSAGLGRSASTAANLNHLDPERARNSPAGSARHRSASPRARSPQAEPAYDDLTSSSEEEIIQTDQQKQSQQSYYTRRGSADPRSSGSKMKTEDGFDEPIFAKPHRQQTWDSTHANQSSPRTHYRPASGSRPTEPDAQQQMRQNLERNGKGPPRASGAGSHGVNAAKNGSDQPNGFKPALYEYPSFPSASKFRHPPPDCSRIETPGGSRKTSREWPYWAIPSSVNPGISGIGQRLAAAKAAASLENLDGNGYPKVVRNANNNLGYSSFSIPSSSSGSASPTKNASTENVNTQFSPTDWHGQFTTPADILGNQTASSSRANVRNRNSPPKRPAMSRSMHTSPPGTSYRQDTTTSPESRPVPVADSGSAAGQQPSPTKFSSDEWNKHFKEGQWAMPPPPPPAAGRPISTPRSRNSRRTAQSGVRSGTGDYKNPFVVDDTGDEGDDEGRASESNLDTDPEMSRQTSTNTNANAMDIDSTTPPASRVSSANSNSNSNGPGPIPHNSAATSPAPGYNFPRPPPPSTAFNMAPLNSAFPLSGGTSSAGLADLKSDLGSTLPFESAASASAHATPRAQKLTLPHVPKLPLPPGRLTQTSYAIYMNQVAVYMREFHDFNKQMLAHFDARQAAMERMTRESSATIEKGFLPMLNGAGGAGFGSSGVGGIGGANVNDLAAWSWMGARTDEGFQRYSAWMEEDQRVRMHWNVAYERHAEALEKLGDVRRDMAYVMARGA